MSIYGFDKLKCVDFVKNELEYLTGTFVDMEDINDEYPFHMFGVSRGTSHGRALRCVFLRSLSVSPYVTDLDQSSTIENIESAIMSSVTTYMKYDIALHNVYVFRMGILVNNPSVVARYTHPQERDDKIIWWKDLCNLTRLNHGTLVKIMYPNADYLVFTQRATNTVSPHLSSDWDIEGVDPSGVSVRWKQRFDGGGIEIYNDHKITNR